MTSEKAKEVQKWVNAYAGGLYTQPQEITSSFYAAAINQFKTEEEREAFHYGTVVAAAEAIGKRGKQCAYEIKYRESLADLGEG